MNAAPTSMHHNSLQDRCGRRHLRLWTSVRACIGHHRHATYRRCI